MADKAMEMVADLEARDRCLATISYDLDGTILAANGNFLDLFGYQAEEIVGGPHAMLLPQDAAVRARDAALWAALGRGESAACECVHRRKGGAEIWVSATYTPVRDPDGRPFKVLQIVSDITASQWRDADHRGQIAAIETSQLVLHLALDGTIIDVNDRFLAVMGYRLDEVLGQHRLMFAPPDAAFDDDAAFWRELVAGRGRTLEYRRRGRDGREIWLSATYTPIADRSGRLFKVVCYASDITPEKRRQADYEGQLAAIGAGQCVIAFNMDGTIIEANDLFLQAVGYSLEEIEGRHHRMFVDPSYAHGAEYATFWGDLAKGRHQAAEYKRLGKDGREVWLQATYNPVCGLDGQPFKIVKYATVVTREKLRKADHQGQIAAIHKAQCVISFDLDGIILDANDNFLAATGYRLANVRGRHHRMFVEPAIAESAEYAAFWKDLARGRHHAGEYRRRGKNGRELWLQATYNPIFDIDGRPFKVVKYATDVTQAKLLQADYEGQIAAISKSQCVIAFDMSGTILNANDNFLAAMGYRLDEIRGRHHSIFVEPGFADTPQYEDFWDGLRSGSFHSAMYKRVGKDGREVWIQASYNPILDPNGKPFKVIKLATDVTSDVALAEALSQAKQQAQHDAATALPNRLRLAGYMEAALAQPHVRLAVLYLDLDRFKPINDTFGHPVGDHVLGEIANRLRRSLPADQIVARVGGDEFVVAAPNLSDEDIEALCLRLLAVVTAPISHDGMELKVGLSIGVAVSPDDGVTPEDLLRCADVALYRSKDSGRGTYRFFANAMNDRIAAHRTLTDDMRAGLAAGQFFLEYQPRFNARTRTVQCVEALVRWAHPQRGRLEPAEFIAPAEKSGLIVPLGEWVLRTACQAAMAWPGISISVNVSPVQFRGGRLIDLVDAVLAETGLHPARLELEITEGVLLEDTERAQGALDALKARGVRLAMDDFGTGFSSLSYLRSFPFDAIKIDRRFVADIEAREGGRSIVQAILGLGKALGMTVTAEGVETTGQLLLLRADDCSEVQGYLLARPMPAAAVAALLAEDDQVLAATG